MSTVISCVFSGSEADRAVAGLLGESERVAREFTARHCVIAVDVTDDLLDCAARHADSVIAIESSEGGYQIESTLSALHSICAEFTPRVVLLGQDTYSQELAPRLAHRLQGCSIGDAQRVAVDDGKIHVTRSVYGGKAVATIRANVEPAVVWLRSRAFAAEAERKTPGPIDRRPRTPDDGLRSTKIVQRQREAGSGVRLEDARVIVSGGRGLGGPEPFENLRGLAKAMNAELGASRAACDAGWVPPGLQVGQTGKKVSPDLYLAIAISGASQHLMGIADAKVVAAINTDPDAPIFGQCSFGLVEDWKNVVDPLRDQLAKLVSD